MGKCRFFSNGRLRLENLHQCMYFSHFTIGLYFSASIRIQSSCNSMTNIRLRQAGKIHKLYTLGRGVYVCFRAMHYTSVHYYTYVM
jgi:hypothetical protein